MTQRQSAFAVRRSRRLGQTSRTAPATAVGLLAVIGLLAACSTTETVDTAPGTTIGASAGPESSTPPSGPTPGSAAIKVPVLPAADQVVPRIVAFDPCFRVNDSLIDQVGFDPDTRERYAAEVTSMLTLTHIGCTFLRSQTVNGQSALTGSLSITTSTKKLAEVSGSERNEVIDSNPINGRPAVVYRSPLTIPTCDAAVESPDGTLVVSLTVPPAPVPVAEPCGQIREVATVMATALDSN
ncbi:DUF3558 domain-containing protein [Nocardia sp. NPDC049707]|uniref:DUF3558 domain-containing protein n=1 Tax=Nocardia sp. NPDC049707 TaxID=3154735 RepID=UPI003447FB5E